MVSPKVSDHYYGQAGHAYVQARQQKNDSLGYELNFRYFKAYLDPSHHVLDFGCGNGGMLRLIKAHVHFAEGMEVNPTAVKMARQISDRIYTALDQLPSTPTFDRILSNHALEHVRDVCSTLERLRQSLKPGGLFITKLPIDDYRTRHSQTWEPHDPDHHLQTWTPRLFANVLYESGFQLRECRVIHSAWHPKLFWLRHLRLLTPACWVVSWLKKRPQLFAVAENPS